MTKKDGPGCVFFDRDGVVNRSPGEGYVLRPEDFHIFPEIPGILRMLDAHGYGAIVVSNQRCVAKGLISKDELAAIHGKMESELRAQGAGFLDVYAATCLPDDPLEPKPSPQMILHAAASHGIDLRRSFLVGDADRDIIAGEAAGCPTIRLVGDKPVTAAADHTFDSHQALREGLERLVAAG